MKERSVIHGTFVIERSYPTTPERVFAAFADPARKRRWFAESEARGVEAFEMDFRVGGREHTRFRLPDDGPYAGIGCTNDTTYQDIETNRRLVFAYTMSVGDKRISASLATFEFLPAEKGTTLIFTDQGAYFDGADGPQIREDGWRKLLEELAGELAQS